MNIAYILTGILFAAAFLAVGRWFKCGNGWKWRALSVIAEKFDKRKTESFIGGLIYAVAIVTGGVMTAAGMLDSDALAAAATGLPLTVGLAGFVYYLAVRG